MPELHFPVASAAFLRKHRARDPAELLKNSRIIANALHPDEWMEWCSAHGLQSPRTSNMITLSSAELVVPAVLDGVGIGMGRRPITDPLLKDGKLVPLFRDRAIGRAAYCLVQRRARQRAAARKVAEWLVEQAQQNGAGELSAAVRGTTVSKPSVGGTAHKKTKGRRSMTRSAGKLERPGGPAR